MAIEHITEPAPLPPLTSSRLRSFRACPRQHQYRYTRGMRSVRTAEPLVFGTLIHRALEGYWIARRDGVADRHGAAVSAIPADTDPYLRARAEAMLAGYTELWDREADLAVLAVEVTFSLPLVNPETGARSRTWTLAGRLDVLVRLADGRIAVIEHKTTSEDAEAGSTYRQRLTLDGQVSVYFDGADSLASAYGYESVAVVIYDVLVKPGARPLHATPEAERKYTKATKTEPSRLYANQRDRDETADEYRERCVTAIAADPNAYYQRVEVVRLSTERDEHAFDVWQLGEAIRHSERTGKAPRNPDACFRYGSACEFWPVCSGTASLSDPSAYRRADDVNEELK
jgi:RecB family exonuclease